MRQALYALTAAALGFAAALFLQAHRDTPQPSQDPDPLALQVELLATQLGRLSRRVERLALRETEVQPARPDTTPIPHTDLAGLEARLAELEARQEGQSLQAVADQYLRQTQQGGNDVGSPAGEALFAAEPEVDNTHYQAVVSDVFSDLSDNLELRDVDCRGSVCRVTYAGAGRTAEGVTTDDDALLSALMQGFEVRQLQLHHGRDEAGNSVLYLKVP